MIVKVLDNCRVLVCRPEPTASELAVTLESMGASCHCLPSINIANVPLSESTKNLVLNLDQYDQVIAVSQHAVEAMFSFIDDYWPQLPAKQQWHAIGRKTAQTLSEHLNAYGQSMTAPKQDFTSEGFLETVDKKKAKDQKVLLLKGKGGREVISDAFGELGAKVEELELYERLFPRYSREQVVAAYETFNPEYIIALSYETLENTLKLAGSIGLDIKDRHFILPSKRVEGLAKEQGISSTLVPQGLMPIDIIKAIAECKRKAL